MASNFSVSDPAAAQLLRSDSNPSRSPRAAGEFCVKGSQFFLHQVVAIFQRHGVPGLLVFLHFLLRCPDLVSQAFSCLLQEPVPVLQIVKVLCGIQLQELSHEGVRHTLGDQRVAMCVGDIDQPRS